MFVFKSNNNLVLVKWTLVVSVSHFMRNSCGKKRERLYYTRTHQMCIEQRNYSITFALFRAMALSICRYHGFLLLFVHLVFSKGKLPNEQFEQLLVCGSKGTYTWMCSKSCIRRIRFVYFTYACKACIASIAIPLRNRQKTAASIVFVGKNFV